MYQEFIGIIQGPLITSTKNLIISKVFL